jgi:glucuronate isomerase
MPLLIGNPVYHWTLLELSACFDIDTPLHEASVPENWVIANKAILYQQISTL